jgi:hypothetical protein
MPQNSEYIPLSEWPELIQALADELSACPSWTDVEAAILTYSPIDRDLIWKALAARIRGEDQQPEQVCLPTPEPAPLTDNASSDLSSTIDPLPGLIVELTACRFREDVERVLGKFPVEEGHRLYSLLPQELTLSLILLGSRPKRKKTSSIPAVSPLVPLFASPKATSGVLRPQDSSTRLSAADRAKMKAQGSARGRSR